LTLSSKQVRRVLNDAVQAVPTGNRGLTTKDLSAMLQRTPDMMQAFLTAVPAAAINWHPGNHRWCIKEIIGHLTEEDARDFAGRIQSMLDMPDAMLSINDHEAVAQERCDCAKPLVELIHEFVERRSQSTRFVAGLTQEDLYATGIHPKLGKIHVHEVLHEWLYHDANHLKQIERNIQSFLWPHLGRMQMFYSEGAL
jgi:hypothetical protein